MKPIDFDIDWYIGANTLNFKLEIGFAVWQRERERITFSQRKIGKFDQKLAPPRP